MGYGNGERGAIGLSVLAITSAIGANLFNAGARTVLYSGKGAFEIAKAAKGTGLIIQETIGGRILQLFGPKAPLFIWKIASAIFAANAKGVVQVFLTETSYSSIFARVEAPIIEFLKNAVMIFK